MTALQHDDLARVLLQVVVILGASRALAFVTRRLGQPSVVAETIAGILLGPSLLGWVAPSAFAWLFPASSLSGLKLLSQLGLVLFMFLVGVAVLVGLASTVILMAHAGPEDAPALADHWRLSGDRLGRARDSLFQRVSVPLLVVHDAGAVAESPRVAEVIA